MPSLAIASSSPDLNGDIHPAISITAQGPPLEVSFPSLGNSSNISISGSVQRYLSHLLRFLSSIINSTISLAFSVLVGPDGDFTLNGGQSPLTIDFPSLKSAGSIDLYGDDDDPPEYSESDIGGVQTAVDGPAEGVVVDPTPIIPPVMHDTHLQPDEEVES